LKAGQMLNLQPRNSYVVQKGDTLYGIAARQGVSISALIQNEQPARTLHAADRPGPGPADRASMRLHIRQRAAGRCAARRPATQAVRAGRRNLRADASRRHRDAAAGRRHHRREPASRCKARRRLCRPSDPAPGEPVEIVPTEPTSPTQTAQIEPPAPKPAPAGDPLPALKPDSPFIWPVDGKVVSKFGPAKDNQRNDGINIAAPVGAPVKASAPGVVAYAGNELRGFGNHGAAAPRRRLGHRLRAQFLAAGEEGRQGRQGQTIARVGSSGNVDTPQLHFETAQGHQGGRSAEGPDEVTRDQSDILDLPRP
jgi:murein DD-endopeptidase MepM/ murein hydrolase activator NlpD